MVWGQNLHGKVADKGEVFRNGSLSGLNAYLVVGGMDAENREGTIVAKIKPALDRSLSLREGRKGSEKSLESIFPKKRNKGKEGTGCSGSAGPIWGKRRRQRTTVKGPEKKLEEGVSKGGSPEFRS